MLLSILHHLNLQLGYERTKEIFNQILKEIPVVIVEFALKEEKVDLSWKELLQDDPLDMIENKEEYNIVKMGEYPTHLSDVKRPMYAISKNHLVVNNKIYPVEDTFFQAYKYSKSSAYKIFYRSEDYFIKQISLLENQFAQDTIKNQFFSAIFILSKIQALNLNLPKLIDYEIKGKTAYIVTTRIKGKLVSDLLVTLSINQKIIIINYLLETLKALKNAGLYHNDVRPWNVMFDIDTNEATLFDFGLSSIYETENTLISFSWMVHALISEKIIIHPNPILNKADFKGLTIPYEFIDFLKKISSDETKSLEDLGKIIQKD
ncbi:MAG: phosphotransferase [bacterium]